MMMDMICECWSTLSRICEMNIVVISVSTLYIYSSIHCHTVGQQWDKLGQTGSSLQYSWWVVVSVRLRCWLAANQWLTNTCASRALQFEVFLVASRSDLQFSLIFTYSYWSELVENCIIIRQFCWTTRWEEFHYDPVNRTGVMAILVRAKG